MDGRLPVAAVFCFLLINVASLEIDPADGGYKDLLIAIHRDVAYNESIVDNIKVLLQSSSEFLHRATNGRVFFKHVTIHFPYTWPKRSSARLVSGNSFKKSDVRFELPASAQKDRPFTKQTRPCGQPGDFIQIPPAFIAELKASTMAKYINPAYVFVHEWAHYRYGVFDEYGSQDDDTFPLTYCDDNKVRLNSCSQEIRFRATTKSGENCMMYTNCQLSKNCTVEIMMPSKTLVESSIMFMPYQNNISQFCDSSTGTRRHNRFAPNKQNRLCQGKSTWEVISANEDFKKVPEPDMTKSIHVTFDETQQKQDLPQRVVLVLDVSGSMDDHNRMEFLQEAAARYIGDIPDGSLRLAIVTFETSAAVHHTLMPVNVNTRKGFLDAVERLKAEGTTCIGCGLERALEVLTTPDETPEGAIILLMSDGEENTPPYLAEVTPKVVAAKVEVSTMAIGTKADNKLEKSAIATKEKAFFFEDLQGNTALKIETAFVEASTSHADEASEWYIMVMDTSSLFAGSLNENFVLDNSLGNNTVVLIQRVQPESASVRAWLIDPNGKKCQDCRVEDKGFITTLLIPSQAEAGKWTLHVETSSRDEVDVNTQVRSQAMDPDEPIRATCKMSSIIVEKANEAIILTEVTKGNKIVLNADVTAEVTRPNRAPKVKYPLNDEGRVPDVRANDGTYSGYFAAFVGKGRYAVTAHASSHKTVRIVYPKPASGSTYTITPLLAHTSDPDFDDDYGFGIPMENFKIVNTTAEENNGTSTDGQDGGPFQRVASCGSFDVTEEILEEQVPPSNIRDLKVVSELPGDNDTYLVTLTWTWPGAHLTSGNASLIEIRGSKDLRKLYLDFENQAEIKKRDIAQGNLDPLPSGAVHKVTLSLPRAFARTRPDGAIQWRAYLACRVANSGGLKSDTSNVVAVAYTPRSLTTSLATRTAATTAEEMTEGTTTEVITTVASTAVSTTTESTTKMPSFTTVEASTSAHGAQGNQESGAFLPVRMWIVIGSITGVIVVAIVVAVLIKRNSNKRMDDSYVNRSLDVQRTTSSL